MNTAELKSQLIAQIMATDDHHLLLKINTLLNCKMYNEVDKCLSSVNEPVLQFESVRIFSEEEQRKINLALEQYNNGECISDEEAQKEIQAWLED
ncbi:hypothetical protein [Flavobacterium praedii]|uniref:hypothetical protein n=1 Tax=Flavobacterium praedii TaxID=3002900 RepID=UPI002481DFC7|nr:hypothetical protein [Flavobacterium praedii]